MKGICLSDSLISLVVLEGWHDFHHDCVPLACYVLIVCWDFDVYLSAAVLDPPYRTHPPPPIKNHLLSPPPPLFLCCNIGANFIV
jgi:hypothetical protein